MKLFFPVSGAAKTALKSLLSLSWPVVISRLGIMLMGFVDTVLVGHYSATELSFHGLAWAPSSVFMVTAMGLTMGIQVKTAHHLGAKEPFLIGAVFQRGMVYAIILGLLSLIGSAAIGAWVMPIMVKPDLAQGALWPIILFALSMPFSITAIAASQFIEALGRTRESMIITLLANGVNLLLLMWWVPGFGPLHGASAAAAATAVSRIFMVAVMLWRITHLPEAKDFGLLKPHPHDPKAAAEQRHIGFAAGASLFIEVSAFAAMTLFAGQVDEKTVAAWVIVLNFASLVFMVPMALGSGCATLVGKAFGAQDGEGVARMGRVAFFAASSFMLAVIILVLVASKPLSLIYTQDQALLGLVAMGLMLSGAFFLPDGLQVVAAQALRARKDIMWPTVIHYVSYGLVMMPLGYLFCVTLKGGLSGLIWAIVVASWVSGVALTARFLWLGKTLSGVEN